MMRTGSSTGALMVPVQLSTATVSKLTGASLRMLDYWARTKLLPPSGQEARGKGSRRLYTFQDVVAILTICKLRERKCPLQQIRTAVRYLKAHYPDAKAAETLARLTLITDGRDVYLLTDERQVMNVVTRQWVWSVPLGLLITEASQKVELLPQEWSETLKFSGRSYRLRMTKDGNAGGYVAECRELPGFMQRARTPAAVLRAARAAIKAMLAFHERRQQARAAAHVVG
jgi:DNA-binding transcriptional MerR regulator